MLDLSVLNVNQKEAVETLEGPIMAIAGAGSGKTRVLTYRLAYLIENDVDPYNILAVTFTNKAAKEMKERAALLTDGQANQSWVSTFHAMCAKILRVDIEKLERYKKNFEIIDEDDSLAKVKEAIKNLNFDEKEIKPKMMKEIICNIKNGDPFFSKDYHFKMLVDKIYNEYDRLLIADNLLDFDDLIRLTVELFETDKDTLLKYQRRFQFIMVDEFQDTNKLQYKLIKMIASRYRNLFIVGDEDQSIYSWRGANIGNIKAFMNDFKEYVKIVLDQNYRSTQNILSAANSVIAKNQSRIVKNLFSNNGDGELVKHKVLESSYAEVGFVVSTIKDYANKGMSYNDIAILYRTNAMSRELEEYLLRSNIPYKIFGGISYFSRKEIKDLIAYLRMIIFDDSNQSLKRVANLPKRGIGKATFTKLENIAKDNHMSMFEAIDIMNNAKLIDFKDTIIKIRERIKNMEIDDFVDEVIELTGYKSLLLEDGEEGQDRLDNIEEFKSILVEAKELYDGRTNLEQLELALEDLTLRTDKNDVTSGNDDNAISIMTFHQSKGLEFELVFMIGMEESIFPFFRAVEEGNLEEERRICYVGITRAKKYLYLSNARSRRLYGITSTNKPSRFISEINPKYIEFVQDENLRSFVRPENREKGYNPKDESDSIYSPGDKVNHKAFGDGVVINMENDLVTIAFKAPYGIKKLLANHPAIKKI